MAFNYYKSYWDQKREESKALKEQGKCTITIKGKKVHVACPYDKEFIKEARVLNGKWREKTEVWVFSIYSYDRLKEILINTFGSEYVTAGRG